MANWWDDWKVPDSVTPPSPTLPTPGGGAQALLPSATPLAPSLPNPPSFADTLAQYRARQQQDVEKWLQTASTQTSSVQVPPQPASTWQTLKDIGGGVLETIRGVPAVVGSAMEGVSNPYAERDWKDSVIESGRQRQQADLQALRDTGEYDRPMGLGMPFTRGEWAENTQSFPYTAATMLPALAVGAVGGAIGGAIGGLGGPAAPATVPAGAAAGRVIGETLGGMLGSYLPAGGAAANQFIRDSLDKYRQDFTEKSGREPTPEEIDAYYKTTVEPQAGRIYHGESAPEAIGTVAELGLMKSAIGDILHGGGSLPVRIAKSGAKMALSAFGVEPLTETITQQIQQPAYAATGLTDEAPRSMTSPEDWLKSAGEVYKQAASTSLFFSALGIPAGAVYGRYQNRRAGNARVDQATQATDTLRSNLDVANEQDIAQALAGFDQVEAQGRLPKAAAERLEQARQQLTQELALRASPEALAEPLETARGRAGYLGLAERADSLSDEQLAQVANRPLPQDAAPELVEARQRYGSELAKRQQLAQVADQLQDPDAAKIMTSTLGRITSGKPMAQGGYGSVDFNLASLSDDMLERYRQAADVLARAEKPSKTVTKAADALNQEAQRRAAGQRRDPESIRMSEIAAKIAQAPETKLQGMLTGLSTEGLDRIAGRLNELATANPLIADKARAVLERVRADRMRQFNPQGEQQSADVQSAMRARLQGWNAGQPVPISMSDSIAADRSRLSELAQQAELQSRQNSILDQEARRRAALEAEISALNSRRPALPTPPVPTPPVPTSIGRPIGHLGTTQLGRPWSELLPVLNQPSHLDPSQAQLDGGLPSPFQPVPNSLALHRVLQTQVARRQQELARQNQRAFEDQARSGPLGSLMGLRQSFESELPSQKTRIPSGIILGGQPIPSTPQLILPDSARPLTADAAEARRIEQVPQRQRTANERKWLESYYQAQRKGSGIILPGHTPTAPTPRLPTPPNVQTRQTAQQAAPSMGVPTGPEGARGARAEGTGAEPGTAAGTVVPQDLSSNASNEPTGRESTQETIAESPKTNAIYRQINDYIQSLKSQNDKEYAYKILEKIDLIKKYELGDSQEKREIAGLNQQGDVDSSNIDKIDRLVDDFHGLLHRSGLEGITPNSLIEPDEYEKFMDELRNAHNTLRRSTEVQRPGGEGSQGPVTPPSVPVKTPAVQPPSETSNAKERKAEAAPLLKQEQPPASTGAVPTPAKKPSRAPKPAPSWNDSTRAEREAILKATGASDEFAQRKANEWTTWDAIPEGPIKKRIRDVLADRAEEDAAPADRERDKAPSNTAPGVPVLKDFKIKDGDKTYSVIRAEVLKKEDGKTFLSATIRGMKGKSQIVIDDAEFDRISAKLSERDAKREAPIPDQKARFDIAEEAEMAPFEATYPGYGKVIVYPNNPIPTGSNLDDEVISYWYFRLRRKVPKADQERFGITIADEHYRISIMRRPDGKRYAQIEYPSAYRHGRDNAGNNAVQVFFRQIPSDSDAIRALSPVYDAAKSLFEKTEKRSDTSEPAPGTKPDLTPAPPTSLSASSPQPQPKQETPNESIVQPRESDQGISGPGIQPGGGTAKSVGYGSPVQRPIFGQPRPISDLIAEGFAQPVESVEGLLSQYDETTTDGKTVSRIEINTDTVQAHLDAMDAALGDTLPGMEERPRLERDLSVIPADQEEQDDDLPGGAWIATLARNPNLSVRITTVEVDEASELASPPLGVPLIYGQTTDQKDISLYTMEGGPVKFGLVDAIEQANAILKTRWAALTEKIGQENTSAEQTLDRYFSDPTAKAVYILRTKDGQALTWSQSRRDMERRIDPENPAYADATVERMTAQAWRDRKVAFAPEPKIAISDEQKENRIAKAFSPNNDNWAIWGVSKEDAILYGLKVPKDEMAGSATSIAWLAGYKNGISGKSFAPDLGGGGQAVSSSAGFKAGKADRNAAAWTEEASALIESQRDAYDNAIRNLAENEQILTATKDALLGFRRVTQASKALAKKYNDALRAKESYDRLITQFELAALALDESVPEWKRVVAAIRLSKATYDTYLGRSVAELEKWPARLREKFAAMVAEANGGKDATPATLARIAQRFVRPSSVPEYDFARSTLRNSWPDDEFARTIRVENRANLFAPIAEERAIKPLQAMREDVLDQDINQLIRDANSARIRALGDETTVPEFEAEMDALVERGKAAVKKREAEAKLRAEQAEKDEADQRAEQAALVARWEAPLPEKTKDANGNKITIEYPAGVVPVRLVPVPLKVKQSDSPIKALATAVAPKDAMRHQLTNVHVDSKYVVATNGHVLVAVPNSSAIEEGFYDPKTLARNESAADWKFPDYERVIPNDKDASTTTRGVLLDELIAIVNAAVRGRAFLAEKRQREDATSFVLRVSDMPENFGFDAKLMLQAISALKAATGAETVTVRTYLKNKDLISLKITDEKSGALAVIMPMRVSTDKSTYVPVDLNRLTHEARRSVPSTATTKPATIAQARAVLIKALGEKHVTALERAGRLMLHEKDPTKTGAAGYVDGKGIIHLIPSNMDQTALDVALHEAMHIARDDRFSEGERAKVRLAHAALRLVGLKNFIGNPGFNDLVQQVRRMAAEGNQTAQDALAKARLEEPNNIDEESITYLAQYADEKLPLVRRILAAIRAALYRMGVKIQLTPADVRALALSALKNQARRAANAVQMEANARQEAFSLPDFAPTESDKAEVERQMKAVKEVRDAKGRLLAPNGKPSKLNERQWKQVRTDFFKNWFGDWENDPENASKVVDENGEPLVVYHGSTSDIFEFRGGDFGVHFGTMDAAESRLMTTADGAGTNYPVFLNIRHPIRTNDLRNFIVPNEWLNESYWFREHWPKPLADSALDVASSFEKAIAPLREEYQRTKDRVRQKTLLDEILRVGADFVDAMKKALSNHGIDGIVYLNLYEGYHDSFMALSPNQIKSAIGNAGTFSNRSARIDYSKPTSEADEAEQARLWEEFQAVRAQFQARQPNETAFQRWFGKGTEGITARDGKPLVLYHGTNNPEFNRWDEGRAGQASTHPTAGLGFFMTANQRSAARYGSRLLELHARINKPYYMTDADLTSIETVQDATRFRKKLLAHGYDGAVITAPGGAPYVVALESKQVKYTTNTNPTDSEDFRYSYAGANAKTANLTLLQQAKARVDAGEDAEQVRQETGWFKGEDDKWRFEIDDSSIKLKSMKARGFNSFNQTKPGDTYTQKIKLSDYEIRRGDSDIITRKANVFLLKDIISHPELFSAYPEIKNLQVSIVDQSDLSTETNTGEWRPPIKSLSFDGDVKIGEIRIRSGLSDQKAIRTLIHEVQHAVQYRAGLSTGISIEKAGGRLSYKKALGEIEARDTANRLNLTPDQRRATPPYRDTMFKDGIKDEDIIVRFDSGKAENVRYSRPGRPSSTATDADYLAAVERGDMETAQRMVNESARAAGYTVGPVFHGGSFNQNIDPVFKMPAGPKRKNNWQLAFGVHFAETPADTDAYLKKQGKMQAAFIEGNLFDGTSKAVLTNAQLEMWPRAVRDRIAALNRQWKSDSTYAFQIAQVLDAMPPAQASRAIVEAGFSGMKYEARANFNNQRFRPFIAYVVVDSPANIKSADPVTRDSAGNVIPLSRRFDQTTPDIRYSRPGRPSLAHPREAAKVLGDIGELRDTLKPGEKLLAKLNPANWRQMLADLKANTRPQWLGLLTQDHVLELARTQLPANAVRQFDDASEKLDAYENRMIQSEGWPLADRWQTLARQARAQADALGRALYMSTWLGVDPRAASAPKGKLVEWNRAKAALAALTNPEARQLYDDVLKFYAGQTERLFKELEARILRHTMPDPDKMAARDLLRQEFERMKDEGPYAPLMRFGDLTVWADPIKPGEKPIFATLETVQDQRAFADWLKSEGYQPRLGVKMEEITKRALPAGDVVGKLAGLVDKNVKGPQADVLKDAMYQLFLRSLPEQAIRKHFIHRKFVPGYSGDALRTYATFARRSAKQIARLAHGDRMGSALDDMVKAVREGMVDDAVAAGHLVNELDQSYQWTMNPQTADWASRLTHLGFMFHLAGSPAHLLLNLSQQAQVTAPWLAGELHGKKGFIGVATALGKANLDFLRTNPFTDPAKRGQHAQTMRAQIEGEYGGDLGKALKMLEESGKTDKSQTYSLSGMSSEDQFLWSKPWLRKTTAALGWFFHASEVINREATAIAAYRLGRDAGMSHEAAYDLARRAINETHFDYSPSNRARFMRGNVAKVITLFKQYSLNVSWQLGRNAVLAMRGASAEAKSVARTKLAGMLGMTAVMAGAVGMPFYNELAWMLTQLMTAFGDDDDPEWDFDTWFRKTLDHALTPKGSEAVRRGIINAFAGVDVSSRVKLDDLWWRRLDDDLHGKQMAYAAMEQALGPVAGLAVRSISTVDGLYDALIEGTSAQGASTRTLANAMPKALKDISKSLRFAHEGATTATGAPLVSREELGISGIIGQGIGFTPAQLTERQAKNTAMLALQDKIERRRRAILDTINLAVWQGDGDVIAALQDDIRKFNKRYPSDAITGDTIQKSIEAGARRRLELQLFGGAPLNKKLAPMLLSGERGE